MMRELEGSQSLMRIYINESDAYKGRPLYLAVVEFLRSKGIAGATVLRGLVGFGAHSIVHTADVLRLSQGLPVVIEVVDGRELIESLVPALDAMISEGLITLEEVRVVKYSVRGMIGQS
jgi:PII-like signaling protein